MSDTPRISQGCRRYQPSWAFTDSGKPLPAPVKYCDPPADFDPDNFDPEDPYQTKDSPMPQIATPALDKAEQMFAVNAPLTDGRPCKSVFNSVAALAAYLNDKDREADRRTGSAAVNRHLIEWED